MKIKKFHGGWFTIGSCSYTWRKNSRGVNMGETEKLHKEILIKN